MNLIQLSLGHARTPNLTTNIVKTPDDEGGSRYTKMVVGTYVVGTQTYMLPPMGVMALV